MWKIKTSVIVLSIITYQKDVRMKMDTLRKKNFIIEWKNVEECDGVRSRDVEFSRDVGDELEFYLESYNT